MTCPDLEVWLYQDATPAREWVVELRKMGFRLQLKRVPKDVKHTAQSLAVNLAEFLSVPFHDASVADTSGTERASVSADSPAS